MRALRTSFRPRNVDGLQIAGSVPANTRLGLGRWMGEWNLGAGRAWVRVTSPATGEVVGFTSLCGVDDVGKAVSSACAAVPVLAGMPPRERAGLCREIARAILARKRDLAALLSLEQGKRLRSEALVEVEAAARAFRDAAALAEQLCAGAALVQSRDRLTIGRRRGLGVVALVAGHAFPVGVPALACLAPAVATGNAVVWLPALTTSLVSAAVVECMVAAGLPEGAVSFLPGERGEIARPLLRHPDVGGAVLLLPQDEAAALAAAAAGKPLWEEECETGLVIVEPDADLEVAARAVAGRTFANAGQLVRASARVAVHAEVHDRFVQALCRSAKGTGADAVGNGPGDALCPVNNVSALGKVERQLADALRRGGRVAGGAVAAESPTGLHIGPAVVSDIGAASALNAETSYGPVIPVLRFRTADELAALVAAGRSARSIAVFTRSPETALTVACRMRAEHVAMNEIRGCLDAAGDIAAAEPAGASLRRAMVAMSPLATLSMRLPGGGGACRSGHRAPSASDAATAEVRPIERLRGRTKTHG